MSQFGFSLPWASGVVSGTGSSITIPLSDLASKTTDFIFQNWLFGVSATGFSGSFGFRVLARLGTSESAVFPVAGISALSTTGFTVIPALLGATQVSGMPRPLAVEICSAAAGTSRSFTGTITGVLANPG